MSWSSIIPSKKRSPLILVQGSTAIEGLSDASQATTSPMMITTATTLHKPYTNRSLDASRYSYRAVSRLRYGFPSLLNYRVSAHGLWESPSLLLFARILVGERRSADTIVVMNCVS